jgi:hypothetical protein
MGTSSNDRGKDKMNIVKKKRSRRFFSGKTRLEQQQMRDTNIYHGISTDQKGAIHEKQHKPEKPAYPGL